MAVDGVTDSLQDIAVLDDIVEVLGGGDHPGCPSIVRPETVAIRHLLPLIIPGVVGVDIVTVNLGKLFSGFVKLV
jgi:hypothetical protein